MLTSVLAAYNLNAADCIVEAFGEGLINNTWKITCNNSEYILQRINTTVFKKPWFIAENIQAISLYLKRLYPAYLFVKPLCTITGEELYMNEQEQYFRLFNFIASSHTFNVVENTKQAYEAAKQFAKFTKLLSGFNALQLKITLPGFHDLSLRYGQFLTALNNGDKARINEARESIAFIQQQQIIVRQYEHIKNNSNFKIRVTHHDTKISNVLFDNNNKGLCVIDLDTVMPGYFISDIGDMMRTYLSPVSEEEKNFDKINIRDEYFQAIVTGYLSEMKTELTTEEISNFVYAGKFLIYMQALRFLTDHFNNDAYYGAKYAGHNLIRANNQIRLLQQLTAKEEAFNNIVQQLIL